MPFVIIQVICMVAITQHIVKNANNKWYLFNDTHVKEIKEDRVVTPAAYCFFYRKHQK